uniref:Uncharacterized protein n=1 Tax=Poecilia latipinna TaxID=48699 RepID=A0A3B3USU7_9TELE
MLHSPTSMTKGLKKTINTVLVRFEGCWWKLTLIRFYNDMDDEEVTSQGVETERYLLVQHQCLTSQMNFLTINTPKPS